MAEQKTFFERLAEERHTTTEDIRRQIAARIETGLHDPDPVRQHNGRRYPASEKSPQRRNGCVMLWNGYRRTEPRACSNDT